MSEAFGPWRPNLPDSERVARLRELRAITALLLGATHRIVAALREAETDLRALEEAWCLLEGLPALPKRRVLATLAQIGAPR